MTSEEGSGEGFERSDATAPDATAPDATAPDATAPDATGPEASRTEEVLDSGGRRIEKFCPKCYLFRTPKENYCIVCGTKLKEIKMKPKKK